MKRFIFKLKSNILPVLLILLIPLVNILYGVLNNGNGIVHSLVTDIDRMVPFVKAFVVPYVLWYPFLFFTLLTLCFNDRKVYYKAIFSIVSGMLTSFLIYHLFQTTVPRPVIAGNDIFSKLVSLVYSTDEPFNCFPSIHVLTSFIMIKGILNLKNLSVTKKAPMVFMAVLIILSTQFIKQHVLLDLIFAILLGEGIYNAADITNLEMSLIWIKKPFLWLTTKKKLET